MPFQPKRGREFEFKVIALKEFFTVDQIAERYKLTRGVIGGIIWRNRPENRHKEKLRQRKRRGSQLAY